MKLLKFLDEKFEEYILIGTLIATVSIIFLQVIMRYVFKNSLSWSEELARYIFLWQAWIATAYAVKKSKHIRVDILKKYIPVKRQKILEMVVLIIWVLFTILFTYESSKLTLSVFKSQQASPAMQIPMGIPYAAVPFGCFLMSIRLIQEIYFLRKSFDANEDKI